MGFETWHDYGYGLCVSKLHIDSIERLQKLLDSAPEYKRSINEWLTETGIENPRFDDYMEYDQDFYNGIATIIKEVIQEAEGVEFTACSNFDGELYVIYGPSYPWFLPENEKALTAENIRDILIKYISILTDENLIIDYCSVENGG